MEPTNEIANVGSILQDSAGTLHAVSDPRKLGYPAGF